MFTFNLLKIFFFYQIVKYNYIYPLKKLFSMSHSNHGIRRQNLSQNIYHFKLQCNINIFLPKFQFWV